MSAYQRGSVKLFFKGDPHLQWYFPLYSNVIDYAKNRSASIVAGSPKYNVGGVRHFNKSTYFDGGVKINVSESASYGNFTQLCWFRAGQYTTDWRMFFVVGGGTNNNNIVGLGIVKSDDPTYGGKVWFGAYFSGGYDLYSPRRYDDNKWHLLVRVRNGSSHLGYVDGNLVISGTISTTTTNPGQEAIAYNRYYNVQPMVGYLSEVSLFSRALSPQEIKSYYKWAIGQKIYFLVADFLFPTSSFLISGQTISKIKTQNSTTLSLSVSESHKLKTISSSSIQFLTTANSKREIPKQLIKDIKTEKINFDITNQP